MEHDGRCPICRYVIRGIGDVASPLLERVAATISDDRKKEKITHSIVSMVKQLIYPRQEILSSLTI